MGRGSAGDGKSRAPAAMANAKKKAATWELPKSAGLHDLSLEEELVNLGFEVQSKVNMNSLKAEEHIDKIKALFRKTRILLPENVKNMSIREYFKKYGGSLAASSESDSRSKHAETVKKRTGVYNILAEFNSNASRRNNDLSRTASVVDASTSTVVIPSTPMGSRSKFDSFTVKTKMTPGGSAAPYIEVLDDSELHGPAIEYANKILANFRQVCEKPL